MKALLEFLQGKKTYVTCAIIFALLFGAWQGWWKIPQEIYAGLMALALVFLRSGAKRDLEQHINETQ